jgi:hypothetical protein
MNKGVRNSLIVLAVIAGAAGLILAGMYFGRGWGNPMGYWSGNMMARGEFRDDPQQFYGVGPGMMGSYDQGGDYGHMGPGMMGQGMMGSFGSNPLLGIEPLSLPEAEGAIQDYLAAFDDEDLVIGEIMIFDNHAYAQIVEGSTGIGAMEVLVDPTTGVVNPEFGPNMMWNLKYSPMAGSGMMGMMGGQPAEPLSAEMPVSADEAVQAAQRYLDLYFAGAEADEDVDSFYGYYTMHINREGSTVGMLSVNGYTGEVFIHSWHGNLLEMSEAH